MKTLCTPVLRHRVLLRAEAEMEGCTPDDVLADLLDSIKVPR